MTACLAVCSWITVPYVIPFTLQTFAVFMSLRILGGKNGFLTIFVYLVLGCIGIPVFSGFTGGFGHLAGATGGYLWGFLLTAVLYWILEKTIINKAKKLPVRILLMFLCLCLCYLCGSLWFFCAFGNGRSLGTVFVMCVIPYIIPDIIKISFAEFLSTRIKSHL